MVGSASAEYGDTWRAESPSADAFEQHTVRTHDEWCGQQLDHDRDDREYWQPRSCCAFLAEGPGSL